MAFDHVAVLVFPDDVEDVREHCMKAGYDVSEPVPSVVVRDRLAQRYGVAAADVNVSILRVHPQGIDRGGVEVFVLPRGEAEALHRGLVARERATEAESHLAWLVHQDRAAQVWQGCRDLGLLPDGGGYNPNEDAAAGGRTVLYFRENMECLTSRKSRRIELTCRGHHENLLSDHRDAEAAKIGPREHLLLLLSGHWAARAVHVAAEIGVADVLDADPLRATEVAARLGCDPGATGRLLRYLAGIGVVRRFEDDDTYVNTELGDLLRSDNAFHHLTRLYAGEFYDAWSDFGECVRTGRTAFSHRYGVEHFDHFARNPSGEHTFGRAMEAVTGLVAQELTRTYAVPDGAMVVDVGGGNGTLLWAVLQAFPKASGVLFDRAHVKQRSDAGLVDPSRFRVVSGDFFAEMVEGGDVYLLSRVLHDWNDEDCARILARCRAACASGATLLVLERFLPSAPLPAGHVDLASVWDLQMLAITGGRERERSEYEKLLKEAGFEVNVVKPLPLDMNLLGATAC